MAFREIEFPENDIGERALSRILLQFRQSEVFLSLLDALIFEVAIFVAAAEQVQKERTCYSAAGEQLDALGRIVGQTRELVDYDVVVWFTPDTFYASVDQAPAWVINAPLTGSYIAGDSWLRQLIQGKILRNHTMFGSVPEIQNMVSESLGLTISIVNTSDVMTIQIIVPDNAAINNIELLSRVKNNNTVDSVCYLPLPATCQIAQVTRLSDYLGYTPGPNLISNPDSWAKSSSAMPSKISTDYYSPDGAKCYIYTDNKTTEMHFIRSVATTYVEGEVFEATIWVKKGDDHSVARSFYMYAAGTVTASAIVRFFIDTGEMLEAVTGSAVIIDSFVRDYGDFWKVSFKATFGANLTTIRSYFYPASGFALDSTSNSATGTVILGGSTLKKLTY